MSENRPYAFYGRIYPERAILGLEDEMQIIHGTDSHQIEINVFIHGSQILIEAFPDYEVENIHTLRNMVRNGVKSLTNPLSFLSGHYVDIEITSVIGPDGHKRVFGVVYGFIEDNLTEEEIREEIFPALMKLYSTEAGEYLQQAFADFRLAMEHPIDTGFFCFRAVESLRQFFDDGGSDSESWDRLRSNLDVDRETIEENIQAYASDRRHGDVIEITEDERNQALQATWDIIYSFINYGRREFDIE